IPLGGYCAFEGEEDTDDTPKEEKQEPFEEVRTAESEQSPTGVATQGGEAVTENSIAEKPRSFIQEKPWKRIIVLLAGGVFNILSAVIFSFLFILIVGYGTPRVQKVYYPEGSETPYCALWENDEIIKVNGKRIGIMHSFEDLTENLNLDSTVTVTVRRNGKIQDVQLTVQTIKVEEETYVGFGFSSDRIYHNKRIGDAFLYAVPFTAKLGWTILGSFFQLITGKIALTQLTGPVGTVSMMADVARMDWRNIFVLLPLIAANLGIFNLLPIPALDGSKVIFTLIEWIRKKPINRKIENYIHVVGLFILMAFVIIVDIVGMVLRR
nr:M50 family metallopeptidase [Clostridiales bacterium]